MPTPCPKCQGSGHSHDTKLYKCQECDGSGEDHPPLMIFWKYDLYPYVLSSRGYMRPDGTAYIPSYGMNVSPTKTMSMAEGGIVSEQLRRLHTDYEAARQALGTEYKAALLQVAPWVHDKKPETK